LSQSNNISGTLLVNCSGNTCKQVIQQAKKMEGVIFVFEVEKKSSSDPGVIINISANENQIRKIEQDIKRINGVVSIDHEIGDSLLYK
jgi:hypothetical protein